MNKVELMGRLVNDVELMKGKSIDRRCNFGSNGGVPMLDNGSIIDGVCKERG